MLEVWVDVWLGGTCMGGPTWEQHVHVYRVQGACTVPATVQHA